MLSHVKSTSSNYILSSDSPWVLFRISFNLSYPISFSTQNKLIYSSTPPGLVITLPKSIISYWLIWIPHSSYNSLAATPLKLFSSSIIPAGHSKVNLPTGNRYYFVKTSFPFNITNIATALPLMKVKPKNICRTKYFTWNSNFLLIFLLIGFYFNIYKSNIWSEHVNEKHF